MVFLVVFAVLVTACRGPAGNQATPVATATPSPTATATATPSLPILNPQLSFYTIDYVKGNFDYHTAYKEPAAMIKVITDVDDPLLTGTSPVTTTSREKIRTTDLSKYYVVIAFQGYRGHGYTGIEIKKVYDVNAIIAIVAEFTEAPVWMGVPAEITSPYHVIAVSKEGMTTVSKEIMTGRGLLFLLYDQIFTIRAETRHRVP